MPSVFIGFSLCLHYFQQNSYILFYIFFNVFVITKCLNYSLSFALNFIVLFSHFLLIRAVEGQSMVGHYESPGILSQDPCHLSHQKAIEESHFHVNVLYNFGDIYCYGKKVIFTKLLRTGVLLSLLLYIFKSMFYI